VKPAVEVQPRWLEALDELVHPETRGTPVSPLWWTLKSTYELARELTDRGFRVSAELVRRLLHQMGYSLQAPAKQNEGTSHPDRDGQFRYINDLVARQLEAGAPVISVDTKKKELIGSYSNGGREWQPSGEPERVNVPTSPTGPSASSPRPSPTASTTSATTRAGPHGLDGNRSAKRPDIRGAVHRHIPHIPPGLLPLPASS